MRRWWSTLSPASDSRHWRNCFGRPKRCWQRLDAGRLDYYHRLERERIHLLLIDDARRGLEDIAAGRTQDAAGVHER